MGKIPTGIAEGSISHFGEFDECLEIEYFDDIDLVIHGRYCLAKLILPFPPITEKNSIVDASFDTLNQHEVYRKLKNFLKLYNLDNYLTLKKMIEKLNNQNGVTLRLGLCFPTTCDPDEFESLLNQSTLLRSISK